MKFYLLNFGPQLLALLFGLISIRRLTLPYCLILAQISFSLFTDIFAIKYSNYHSSNEIIYNIYLIIETALLSSAIFYSITSNTVKRILGIALLAYLCFVLFAFSNTSILRLNYPILILGFILVALSNLYYIIHPTTEKSILTNPFLIISIGHVIYFLGVTPYFIARDLIIGDDPIMETALFSYINLSLMVLRYIACATAFMLVLRKNYILQFS